MRARASPSNAVSKRRLHQRSGALRHRSMRDRRRGPTPARFRPALTPCRRPRLDRMSNTRPAAMLPRAAYADMFGPTTGDRIRLADTSLVIEVERDHTTYGEEVKFGGGKVIRDGMGQSQATNAEGAA